MLSGLLDLTVIVREGQIKFYHSLSLDFGSPRLSQVSGSTFFPSTARREHTALSRNEGADRGPEKRREREQQSRVGRGTQM